MVRSGLDPLAGWLHDQLAIQIIARTPVGGGCIHSSWCLQTAQGERLFAKTNRSAMRPLLEAEAEGLVALAAMAPPGLTCPTPLALGLAGDQAVLVLPWLDLARGGQPEAWEAFGADLARVHRNSLDPSRQDRAPNGGFGWKQDNFIGSSPQPNGWRDRWSTFFSECRLTPQLRWLARKGHVLKGADTLLAQLPELLDNHGAQPCVVHGDLWAGNGGLLSEGGASLFDPAIYRGDRESDLAMAQLFGGFPEAFFTGYQHEWPLAEGWQLRAEIYKLYHLLNHANIFGGSYLHQSQLSLNNLQTTC